VRYDDDVFYANCVRFIPTDEKGRLTVNTTILYEILKEFRERYFRQFTPSHEALWFWAKAVIRGTLVKSSVNTINIPEIGREDNMKEFLVEND
jgi:hypothetical protein